MRVGAAVGIRILTAMQLSIAVPHVVHAQPPAETHVSCEQPGALQRAVEHTPAGGRILIREGTCAGNITLVRDVRIQGAGSDRVILRAADPALPVLTVPRGVTATISNVTLTGGRVGLLVTGRAAMAFAMVSDNASGGIEVRDNGAFEGDKLRITGNKGSGLAVIKAGASLRGSIVGQNATRDGGGGLLLIGGRAELTATQLEENDAVFDGGGILALQKSTLVLDRVQLARNTTRTGHGGAIAINGSVADIGGGSLLHNRADAGNGGAVAVLNGGELEVSNTTLASNVASFQDADLPGGWGGGIYVDKASKAALVHATIVRNSARFGAGIASNNVVTVHASLLSGNLGAIKDGECGGSGRIESRGWNLLMSLGECRFESRPGDLIGASPRLGEPGSYGGAWTTMPLRDGSPALDRIPLSVCGGGLDQRLKPRPANGGCDVGAFERQPDERMP